MNKKLIFAITSLLVASLLLTSCGSKGKTSALSGDGTDAVTATDSAADKTDPAKDANTATDKNQASKDNKSDTAKKDSKSEKSNSAQSESSSANTAQEKSEEVQVTPTFMFFTSNSDADHEKTMSVIEDLKKSYGSKVNFDLVDIDSNPDAKKNFPVEGQTPALIMLNTSNDICAFEFKITEKAKMEDAIKKALGE